MRIVPVLLLGFFVCNSIKTWNMNMYFGPHYGFKMFMKFEFMYYNYFAKGRYFRSIQGFALASEKLAEFSSLQSRFELMALQSHLNVVF